MPPASVPPARRAARPARRGTRRQAGMLSRDTGPEGPAIHRRLSAQVIQLLGRRIVAGAYPEGTALPNEALLCAELGVSRTALREGVKVLVAKGLLVARPRVGTRVQPRVAWQALDADVLGWRAELPPDDAFITELAEMREIIEPGAAALAAANHTAADMTALDAALLRMSESRSQAEWVAADFDFHSALLHATGNALLVPLAALISSALQVVLALAATRTRETGRDYKTALPDHARVLEAVRHRDAQAAHQAMSLLLSDTRRRLKLQAADGAAAAGRRRAARR